MRRVILLTILYTALGTWYITFGQALDPRDQSLSPRTTMEIDNISISYGQPLKRNREIFGKLVPYGQVWRTGANQATEITFKKNCVFAWKRISKGTYTLFTIPREKEWEIILNSELNQWRAFGYESIKDKDNLRRIIELKNVK